MQEVVADDAAFTVVLTIIYDLDRGAREDQEGVLEIQAALGGIVGDAHLVTVFTETCRRKSLPSGAGRVSGLPAF